MTYTRHDLSDYLYRGDVVSAMRALLPKGQHDVQRQVLHTGVATHSHTHEQWVALFYEFPGDPALPIIIEGQRVAVSAGECIVLHPGVEHRTDVYEGEKPRTLIAVLVEPYEP